NMEISRCVWMRRVGMASANSLLRMTFFSSISAPIPPLSYSSLKQPYPPLNLISHRRSLCTPTHSSSSPIFSTSDNGCDDKSGYPMKGSRVLLKGMRYAELEKWVQSHGYRPAQALMLWKRLYGNNIWAHCCEELEGLNRDFKKMLGEHAEFKTVYLKDILTASDGTRKEVTDFIHIGRWTGNRNSCDTLS
ncbi:unnamed protein product, partial [Ilex paraguariensis]